MALLTGICVVGLAATARAGDFVDTRATFIFSDDNVLAGPGETLINSPSPDFGPREGNFFPFENLDTRDSGQETLTHLVLYGAFPGFNDHLLTEAAVVVRADLFGNGQVGFRDDGSYLKLTWSFEGPVAHEDEAGNRVIDVPHRNLGITLFPFTSERFRLGYLFDLSWGDQGLFTELSDSPVPAMRVQYNDDWGYSFVGAKTTRQLQAVADPSQPGNNELEAFYGFLGGLGVNIGQIAMLEVNGGFFRSGTNRKPDVVGQPVDAYGVSSRLSFFNGMRPGTSIDFRLYQNTPEFADAFLRHAPSYAETLQWLISVEGSWLAQTLGDPDVVGATTVQSGFAGALTLNFAIGNLDTQAALIYRDLAYLLRNVPSLDPLNAFPKDSQQDPEILAAISGEYSIPDTHITPGLLIGMQVPAVYRGLLPSLPNAPVVTTGVQTVVVRNARNFEPLPPGENALPVYSAKLSVRWDLSEMISVLGQVLYSHDPNQTRLEDNEFGYATRVFRNPEILGFGIITQARF